VLADVKKGKVTYGYNAATGEYGDMLEMGILDPTKVTRLLLTTEVMVTEAPRTRSKSTAACRTWAAWATWACQVPRPYGPMTRGPGGVSRALFVSGRDGSLGGRERQEQGDPADYDADAVMPGTKAGCRKFLRFKVPNENDQFPKSAKSLIVMPFMTVARILHEIVWVIHTIRLSIRRGIS